MKIIEQAAEYIRAETDKLDAPISYACALRIARHLHDQWEGKTTHHGAPFDIAQHCRQRYDGDNWDCYED